MTSLRSERRPSISTPSVCAFLLLAAGLGGCETPPRQGERPAAERSTTDRSSTDGARTNAPGARPIAAWRERTLTDVDLAPALAEAAGAAVVREAFLDLRLAQALAERSITIDAAMVAQERAALVASLDSDPNVAERLLEDIRRRQGLGPVRFDALLRRNAGLRALVRDDVRMTEDALARQHDLLYGPKRVARIIALQTLADADAVRKALDAGTSFGDLAVQRSTDASAARGGLLGPISRSDPSWPEAFRSVLFGLSVGETSAPTLVDESYLIVRLEEERPGGGPTIAAARAELEQAYRAAQERILMEERARAFVNEIRPVFYDDAFSGAWRRAE
jgi:parvulin-like peptidyl-prolyl isomerase